jgi:hypothetical protein
LDQGTHARANDHDQSGAHDDDQGRWTRHRRSAVDHRWRQPRPAALVSVVRAFYGTAPIPVSSGGADRHRLSRGGDRHLEKGRTISAVFRALKRAIAREILQALTGNYTVPDYSDLRPARRAKTLTLAAAQHLGVWPSRIGEPELGHRPNDDLTHRYLEWFIAA